MHALIIEQDAWTVLMIEDALTDFGYSTFDVAASGEEALILAQEHSPDLITSDVRLGTTSGIDTVRTISSSSNIPVVFVTATGWEVHQTCPELAVVQKPFTPADLKTAIGQAVSKTVPANW